MQTIQDYADEVAANDKGQWRAATRRAAELIRHRHPTVDLSRRIPLTQILLLERALVYEGLLGPWQPWVGSLAAATVALCGGAYAFARSWKQSALML